MNKYHPVLKSIALFAFIFILTFDFFTKDWPELFSGAQILVQNGIVLSQSYLVGFIIYLLSAYYPWVQQESVRDSEQKRMNELIAHRLKQLITDCMFVMYMGMDSQKEQGLIYLQGTTEQEFESMMNNTFHYQNVRHARVIRVPGEQYGRVMTVGENILDCTNSVKTSIDGLLKLERFMTIELVELLYKVSELSLIKNWENYLDDTPFLINGRLLQPEVSPIGTYKQMFVEFDQYYREIEKEFLKLGGTIACTEHVSELKTLREEHRAKDS
ncbi:hypothetical protein [Photobacterium leiognathi]|uniref:hypothetical protein n=1 Tax=Photobacterium leiognathi TaxID=553611 RepID=UPI00298283EA|nr:hypothetical protein [Photobacterium leiognathi]